MTERVVLGIRIGKRLAYVHPVANGRMAVFMPDQFHKEDLHNEVLLTQREAVRLARAILKQAEAAR